MGERILVVGEALMDVVHRQDGSVAEFAGGSPLNVAIGLARLGHEVQFASRFGRDRRGEMLRAHLAGEPLLTITAGTDLAEYTSTAKATLDPRGAATYEFDLMWDVAAALDQAPVGHLHTGSIGAAVPPGAQAVYQRAREIEPTGTISYDPNARPALMGTAQEALELVSSFVGLSDVVSQRRGPAVAVPGAASRAGDERLGQRGRVPRRRHHGWEGSPRDALRRTAVAGCRQGIHGR